MRILVTGVAGFIGMHVAVRLLADGHEVVGIDNLNNYYDVRLKQARLAHIGSPNQFHFEKLDLCDRAGIHRLFAERQPEIVINLAAQAGVRYSLENPHSYIDSNLVGFTNILEACRHFDIGHLIYASSSSVYGLNSQMPFTEEQIVDQPASFYGATKKANELLAHSYSHTFSLPTTGLRFFTVYGPWGRPDMAPMIFANAIMDNKKINLFNSGEMTRDFTYIDDIVEGLVQILNAKNVSSGSKNSNLISQTYQIFNLGNGNPTPLKEFVNYLESELGRNAKVKNLPMVPGDIVQTFASVDKLKNLVGFIPKTELKIGIKSFVKWFLEYRTEFK